MSNYSHEFENKLDSASVIFPGARTLKLRFHLLVKERRSDLKIKMATSGISEEYGEKEKIVYSIIEESEDKFRLRNSKISKGRPRRGGIEV